MDAEEESWDDEPEPEPPKVGPARKTDWQPGKSRSQEKASQDNQEKAPSQSAAKPSQEPKAVTSNHSDAEHKHVKYVVKS